MSRERTVAGRLVVLTGGGRGIGAATARALAAEGARMVLLDLDADAAASVAAEVGGASYGCDVTDLDALPALVDRIETEQGRIDVWINNAGIMPLNRIEDEPASTTRAIVELNLMAVLVSTKELVRRFKERGQRDGHVVNISSAAGRSPIAGAATYSASKAAVSMFSNALHFELRADEAGVDVSAVHPGMVSTELATGFTKTGGIPPATPEQVAEAVLAVVRKPRMNVYVPAVIDTTLRVGGLMPSRLGEWTMRATGGDKVALAALADPARAAYEQRAAHSAPAAEHPAQHHEENPA